MLTLNLLQDPKPGRPLKRASSYLGARCDVCGSTEKMREVSGGQHAGKYVYERCAPCRRRAVRARYLSSAAGRATTARYRATPAAHAVALEYGKRYRKRDRVKERAAQNQKRWRTTNNESAMLHGARYRAKKCGIIFAIGLSDVNIPERCPILGVELSMNVGFLGPYSPSLDRIDPSAGYVPGNVWVISHRANRIKSDATLGELRLIVAALEERALCQAGV